MPLPLEMLKYIQEVKELTRQQARQEADRRVDETFDRLERFLEESPDGSVDAAVFTAQAANLITSSGLSLEQSDVDELLQSVASSINTESHCPDTTVTNNTTAESATSHEPRRSLYKRPPTESGNPQTTVKDKSGNIKKTKSHTNPSGSHRKSMDLDQPKSATEHESVSPSPSVYKTLLLNCLFDDCSETFRDQTAMDHHLCTVHKMLGHRCFLPGCGNSFDTADKLEQHLKQQHAQVTIWECAVCDINTLISHDQLASHVELHHFTGQFQCMLCYFKSDTRSSVIKHHQKTHSKAKVRQSISQSLKAISCHLNECTETFQDFAALRLHQREKHSDSPLFKSTEIVTKRVATAPHLFCKWTNCSYSASVRGDIEGHIRQQHFKLPRKKSIQAKLGIVDDRDANQWIEVKRLE